MKLAILALFLISAVYAQSQMNTVTDEDWAAFATHLNEHNIKYPTNELINRFNIFKKVDDAINANNNDPTSTVKLGHNEHSTLTPDEWKKMKNGDTPVKKSKNKRGIKRAVIAKYEDANKVVVFGEFQADSTFVPPANFSWVTKGYNLPVRNQAKCGCCWAFASSAAIEGYIFAQTSKLVRLSPQELLDCSVSFGNNGCNGGVPYYAYDYVLSKKALALDSSYTYTGVQGTCGASPNKVGTESVTFSNYYLMAPSDASIQEALINNGPIAIAIDANNLAFQYYKSGVLTASASGCTTTPDHAVLLVGYGTDPTTGLNYWLIKNQWGTTWGNQGYIQLQRNGQDTCGIYSEAAVPIK